MVHDHEGAELLRVGGRWDPTARCWDRNADVAPHVIRLKESQRDVADAFVEWLESSRRGQAVDPLRIILLILAGARGSGKTWFVGLMIVVIGLEWLDEWQYSVNLSTGQRREIVEGIEEVAQPEWIKDRSDDPRDPWLRFITGSKVAFVSARNPRRLREAKLRIRAVHVNEAQDQDEEIYINAISASRNVDGLTTLATNRPRNEGGDWVSIAATAVLGKEIVGRFFLLDPRKNDAVSSVALEKRAAAIRAVSAEAAAADTDPDAPMAPSGPIAYRAFSALPASDGGHIGNPPQVGWTNVTRELTAKELESEIGYDYVLGVDWQQTPGVCGQLIQFYRDEHAALILHVLRTIAVRGVEAHFSQALRDAGFATRPGFAEPSVLIVGDATGARQNSEHKFHLPDSYKLMLADGWRVIPPMSHWKTGTPWNPLVRDSRAQMHLLLERRWIRLSATCKEPCEGFPSLIDSFRRAKVGPKGGLIEKGDFQHGPDGVRYAAWRFMPRPTPKKPVGIDDETYDALSAIRVLTSG